MKISDFFSWIPWAQREVKPSRELKTYCLNQAANIYYKQFAIQVAISKIANAIAMCEFETYKTNDRYKDKLHWILNYEPNKNQNKVDFWHDVITKMVYDENGALIVQSDEGFLVCAESYEFKEYAFMENVYTDIVLPGDYKLESSRTESKVIHLVLSNSKVKEMIDGVYNDYGRLIGGSIRNYNRGNAMKVVVKIGSIFDQFRSRVIERADGTTTTEYDRILDDIMESRLEGMLSDGDSATPLEAGLELEEMKTSANTKSGAVTTRDIKDTFMDIMDFVADAFHIPRGLMKGDVADAEAITNNFVTYSVRPIVEQIDTELNRKLYGRDNVLKGTKLKVDYSTVATKNPVNFANAAEALLRIGAYSVNDVLRKLGEEEIQEDWANEHYVTKNYENIKQEGGVVVEETTTN